MLNLGALLEFDYLMKFSFAIISLFVSLLALMVYRLSGNQQSKWFGVSFFLISISYFIQSALNFSFAASFLQQICYPMSIKNINIACQNLHMLFYIAGLTTLTYMSLKIQSIKTLLLLILINVLSLVFATSANLFFLLSSIMLFFVFIHFLHNYLHKKQSHSMIALIAFALIFANSVHNLLNIDHNVFLIITNFTQLLAFFLIFVNLFLIVRK